MTTKLSYYQQTKANDCDHEQIRLLIYMMVLCTQVNKMYVIADCGYTLRVAITYKSDYIDKANTLLNDTETYQPLDTDPSKTTVNRINQKLKQLKDKDKLNETTYHRNYIQIV